MNKLLMEQYETNLLFESTKFKFIETYKDYIKIYFNKIGDTGSFDNHIEHRLKERSMGLTTTEFIIKLKKFLDILFTPDELNTTNLENVQNHKKFHNKIKNDDRAMCLFKFERSWIKIPANIVQYVDKNNKKVIEVNIITVLNKKAKDDNYRSDAVLKLAENHIEFCKFIL